MELARAFAANLIAELQRTVEARHDFIASVSHELRTPLTSISGYSETLLQRWAEVAEDQKLDLLTRVLSNSRELARLVEELIDLAALERGRRFVAQIRPIDLDEAMTKALETAEIYLRERKVSREFVEATILVDPDMFARALANLLSNAAKYSPSASPIHVRAFRRDGQIRVEVEDEGMGLAPHETSRVFDPFWRATSSVSNAIRGSGIGLSLVREYVRTMGGRIGVDSEPGEGSTFWFTVPLAEGDGGAAGAGD